MSRILGLDTSNENAGVILIENEKIISQKINYQLQKHASFIHTAIEELLVQNDLQVSQIDAFSIVNGPGSYTGLRISLSTIKAFCYALNKPLIAVNTLDVYANACDFFDDKIIFASIDARRSEVFGAFYFDKNFKNVKYQVYELNEALYRSIENRKILAVGGGAEKFYSFNNAKNTIQIQNIDYANFLKNFANISIKNFCQNEYADVYILEPFYLKEVFITPSKK